MKNQNYYGPKICKSNCHFLNFIQNQLNTIEIGMLFFLFIFFYLQIRKLWVNNMGFYSVNEQKMLCILWDEYTGTKETDEMLSVLWMQLQPYLSLNKRIEVWCDNCTAQNQR